MTNEWLKPNLTPESVQRMIAEQFPEWRHLPVQRVALDGWDNTTFRLGDHMSVRLPSHREYAAQVDKEHKWLPVLAGQLPQPIPLPLAKGEPTGEYPLPWSVYRWLEGEPATTGVIADKKEFAVALGEFLLALWRVDAAGGPQAGKHNFHRGGDLSVYDGQTRTTMSAVEDGIDPALAIEVWDAARASKWTDKPVWVHGDVAPGNLLVDHGKLCGVIDFGCSGVGDPACDLVVAWTFLEGDSREAFRETIAMDDLTWARARGWALWKALITLEKDDAASRVVEAVLAEHYIA